MWFCGSLLCVLLALHGGEASRAGPAPAQYDCIVVGLGSAGVTAAAALARAGRRVLALEAQARIGGRVHTLSFGDGVVELGAEWIQGTEKSPIYDLAVQNNITVLPDDSRFDIYYSDGSFANQTLVVELMGQVFEQYQNQPETPESTGQHITKKLMEYISSNHPELVNDTDFISGLLDFADLNIDSIEACNSWNDVSTTSTAEDLGGHQSMSWHRHGYKTFFDILLNTYNGGPGLPTLETRLGAEVTNIAWPREPTEDVRVTTADGTIYRARSVIVTVSLGVLKDRYQTLFTPELPQAKITAIEDMSIGLLAKVIFSFENAWWGEDTKSLGFLWKKADRDAVADENKWTTRILGASMPMGSSNTLTFWTSGETAKKIESLSDEEVKQKVLDMARQFIRNNFTIPEPTGMLKSSWHSNPFTRGSYTYDNLLTPQNLNGRVDLGEPLVDNSGTPRVLFAGEATEPKHYGYVHGASETGLREANRLLSLKT